MVLARKGCDFSHHEDGSFGGIAIVIGTNAGAEETVVFVEADGRGVGFANFEEKGEGAAGTGVLLRRSEQPGAITAATTFGKDGEIQDFGFVRNHPQSDRANDS